MFASVKSTKPVDDETVMQSEGDCAFAIHTNPSDFPPSQEYGRDPYYPAVNIFCVVNRIGALETVS